MSKGGYWTIATPSTAGTASGPTLLLKQPSTSFGVQVMHDGSTATWRLQGRVTPSTNWLALGSAATTQGSTHAITHVTTVPVSEVRLTLTDATTDTDNLWVDIAVV